METNTPKLDWDIDFPPDSDDMNRWVKLHDGVQTVWSYIPAGMTLDEAN